MDLLVRLLLIYVPGVTKGWCVVPKWVGSGHPYPPIGTPLYVDFGVYYPSFVGWFQQFYPGRRAQEPLVF